jgi:RNA polymerase sigma-70 factor (ECF subfamily)
MTHRSPMDDAAFKAELVAMIPHLRAFARSLAGKIPEADDLAQDAMLRGWQSRASYLPGTNLKAWLFTILRNQFLSEKRRSWRRQPLDPEMAENTLIATSNPSSNEELIDLRSAMEMLPDDQREALILIGAAGLSYEETAEICGCAIGTIKSRVSRARKTLVEVLENRSVGSRAPTDTSAAQVCDSIMAEAAALQRRSEPRTQSI